METKANYVLVGAFCLLILTGALTLLWWTGLLRDRGGEQTVQIVFVGPVTGLENGSSVLFNGIKVGWVSDVQFHPEDVSKIVITARLHSNMKLPTDTKVRLEYQGLTGIARLHLVGGFSPGVLDPDAKTGMLRLDAGDAGGGSDVLSATHSVFGKFSLILKDLTVLVRDLHNVVEENKAPFSRIIKNVDHLLASEEGEFTEILQGIGEMVKNLNRVAVKGEKLIDESTTAVHSLAGIIDGFAKYEAVLGTDFAFLLQDGVAEVRSFAIEGRMVMDELQQTLQRFDRAPREFLFGHPYIPEY